MEHNETNHKKKETTYQRVSAFDPQSLLLGVALSFLSAVVCMQIIGKIGLVPNTSLIGGVFAMLMARIPLSSMKKFKTLERQNLVQTTVSGAGLAASNCGLLAVGIFFVMGETQYILPMAFGSIIGCLISIFTIGKVFDSIVFPGAEAWPSGVATAAALEAGDKGGDKGKRLIQGFLIGILGSVLKIPVAGIGLAFIANIYSISALGIGLIVCGYSPYLFNGYSLVNSNIPRGFMIGAGVVALIQTIIVILKGKNQKTEEMHLTVTNDSFKKAIIVSSGLHIVGVIAVGAITGILSQMPIGQLIFWVLYTGISATVATILVGMASMKSGWAPAFAITVIFMSIGAILGFPPIPLAVLTGYISAAGPCFADMGYDLKTGWILRGRGADPELEVYGRKQQVYSEVIGALIGIGTVIVFSSFFFDQGLIPPASKVFASAAMAGTNPEIVRELLLWAIPGAIIQFAFGPAKMVGVLMATGLLINNPLYGVGILVAVVVRRIFGTKFMEIRDAGLIVGDGIYGFLSGIFFSL